MLYTQDSARIDAAALYSAAIRYLESGFSVIPLFGECNPARAKHPMVKWSRYQHVSPTAADCHEWFMQQGSGGLGIVCGRVSQLLVLDFDDPNLASEFRRFAPDLADTFTVASGTRRLPHLYWRISEGRIVPTRSVPGADLRGEGSYVVAPPTTVGAACWSVLHAVEPRLLTPSDLTRVLRFLSQVSHTPPTAAKSLASSDDGDFDTCSPVEAAVASEFRRLDTPDSLADHYRSLVHLGRNQALFRTTCLARDDGWPHMQVVVALAGAHARQPGSSDENFNQRYAEAIRTIASAYQRSPRRSAAESSSSTPQLPNAIREALLQNRLTGVARVLDGLALTGLQPGAIFSEREACEHLATYGIGRRSVMAALKAEWAGARLIPLAPPDTPQMPANAATPDEVSANSCEMSTGAKRVKIRGRIPIRYSLPYPEQLATILEVECSPSDAVETAALGSPAAYRRALHERLIARRPGQYARQWLSQRLGVSKWTTRRYEAQAGIRVMSTYSEQPLNPRLVGQYLSDRSDPHVGAVLVDQTGKRYPALKTVALRLMKCGHRMTLRQQQPNVYRVDAPGVGIPTLQCEPTRNPMTDLREEVPLSSHVLSRPAEITAPPLPAHHAASVSASVGIPTPPQADLWLCPECRKIALGQDPPDACPRCASHQWERIPEAIWRDTERCKAWWRGLHHTGTGEAVSLTVARPSPASAEPLPPASETLSQQLRSRIDRLSLGNARQVVREYGAAAVEKALHVLAHRPHIQNPAGFLVSLLRSEAGASRQPQPSIGRGQATALDWVKQLAQSAYLNFFANADEVLGKLDGTDLAGALA